jgi:hypothetical protein
VERPGIGLVGLRRSFVSDEATVVPPDLTNVVAVAAGFHDLALIGNGTAVQVSLNHPAWTTDGFSVSLLTQSGRVYVLEYKNKLEDTSWTPLPLVAGTGHEHILTDPATMDMQRFYRVRRW